MQKTETYEEVRDSFMAEFKRDNPGCVLNRDKACRAAMQYIEERDIVLTKPESLELQPPSMSQQTTCNTHKSNSTNTKCTIAFCS